MDLRIDEPPKRPKPERVAYKGALAKDMAELEREIEMVDGKAADLLKKYEVTSEKIEAGGEILSHLNSDDFVHEAVVHELERGNVLELDIEGFDSFRILKVSPTEMVSIRTDAKTKRVVRFERSICLVEIRAPGKKPGRKELVVTFPIAEGELLVCHDPKTQELLVKCPILSVQTNRKTLKDRFLLLFAKKGR